jgi:DNA-binding response OmpR family regulator
MRAVIIEDNPDDTRIALRVARLAGFEDVETFTSLDRAVERIEQGLKSESPLPDVIIVDLVLGQDSGFEILRHWRATWPDSAMRLIVWTEQGEHTRELCDLFHIDAFVSKWRGEETLRKALEGVTGKGSTAWLPQPSD